MTWPELVRHFLEAHPSPMLGQDAAEALDALRTADYSELPGRQRLILLEALIHAAADTETVRKCGLTEALSFSSDNTSDFHYHPDVLDCLERPVSPPNYNGGALPQP